MPAACVSALLKKPPDGTSASLRRWFGVFHQLQQSGPSIRRAQSTEAGPLLFSENKLRNSGARLAQSRRTRNLSRPDFIDGEFIARSLATRFNPCRGQFASPFYSLPARAAVAEQNATSFSGCCLSASFCCRVLGVSLRNAISEHHPSLAIR
jgi:hypothetical protein